MSDKKPVRQKKWQSRRAGGGKAAPAHAPARRSALLALGLAGLLLGAWFIGLLAWKQLSQSAFFQLTAISVDGCARTTKEEVLALSGVDVHSNLLALSLDKVRRQVEAHEWIESARVRRDWPNRLRITIQERRPVALLNLPGGLYYTDRQGVPFAPAAAPEDLDFPVITGLGEVQEWQEEQRRAVHRALKLIRLAGRGGVTLPAQGISEINLGPEGGMTLFLVSRPFPVYLGNGAEMVQSYNRLVRVLDWLYKERVFAETVAIRMDYLPDQVLVMR